jgi:hypothetical protein
MKKRIAIAIAGAELGLYLVVVVLGYLARSGLKSPAIGGAGFVNDVALLTPMLAFPLFGGLIASRRPSNPIGWICLASGAAWFLNFLASAYAVYGLSVRRGSLPGAAIAGALALWVPAVGLLGTYLFLLFPDGRLLSRRWRTVAWAAAIAIAGLTIVVTLGPGPVAGVPGTHNPLTPHGTALAVVNGLGFLIVVFFACIVASVTSLVLRYRRSGADDRERLKWIAFAGVVFVTLFGAAIVVSLLFEGPATAAGRQPPVVVQVFQDLAGAVFALMPTAAFFAVLRYRLYDIDRVISRTLSYGIVTAVLAGGYVLIALVPTAILGGGHVPSGLVAGAVLVVAAMFRPVRRRVQNAVDHRFNRARYDAEHTIDGFAARLRDQIDVDTLKVDLEALVRHTMEPSHVSLWLR